MPPFRSLLSFFLPAQGKGPMRLFFLTPQPRAAYSPAASTTSLRLSLDRGKRSHEWAPSGRASRESRRSWESWAGGDGSVTASSTWRGSGWQQYMPEPSHSAQALRLPGPPSTSSRAGPRHGYHPPPSARAGGEPALAHHQHEVRTFFATFLY